MPWQVLGSGGVKHIFAIFSSCHADAVVRRMSTIRTQLVIDEEELLT
jgi:hypothetical protein